MAGGGPAALGRNYLQRRDGRIEMLSGTDQTAMAAAVSSLLKRRAAGAIARSRLAATEA
jgi:hypothetical protein